MYKPPEGIDEAAYTSPISNKPSKKRLSKILGVFSGIAVMFASLMVPLLSHWKWSVGLYFFMVGMLLTALIIVISYDISIKRRVDYERLPKVLQVLDQILRHVGLLLGIPSLIGIFALVGFSFVKMPNLLPVATDLAMHPFLQWTLLVTFVIFLVAIAGLTWHYLSNDKKDIQQGEQPVGNHGNDDTEVELEAGQKDEQGHALEQKNRKKSTGVVSSRPSEHARLLGSSSSTYGTNAGNTASVIGNDFSGSVATGYTPSSGQGANKVVTIDSENQLDLDSAMNAQQQPQPRSYVPSGADAF